eukprot:gene3627-biopygen6504
MWSLQTFACPCRKAWRSLLRQRLFDFGGAELRPGESRMLRCGIEPARHLTLARGDGARALHPGRYELIATLGRYSA